MAAKIFRSTIFVALIVLLCSVGVILGVVYDYFDTMQAERLRDELRLAASGVEELGLTYLEGTDPGRYRLTWVDSAGRVLYDTQADQTAMENHLDREEILQALREGSGSAVRYSATLTEKTVYEALLLRDGSVLRLSESSATTATLLLGMLQPICVILFIALVLSGLLSHRMAKRIVAPLNSLDLEHPLQNDAYEELSPMLDRLSRQHLQIDSQLKTLRWKTEEFQHITRNMREGLVLLDGSGLVLSINPAAQELFRTGDFAIGKDFLALEGTGEVRDAVNRAYLEGAGEGLLTREGRSYRLSAERTTDQGDQLGAVVLTQDVTEQLQAQRARQEFSANVSHELKTPLQSIMGSAELLEQGMVKTGDIPKFAGLIRREAERLLHLVQDIINLSQLDEGGPMPREQVDMLPVLRETAAGLASAAEEKRVTLEVTGEDCVVSAVPRLLGEIVFNLMDNAIRYNVPGGSVTASCRREGAGAVLTVSDTGIGIPPEHQQRVFQRFYRVDKSHSRASGGTGLGLAIVKHAAEVQGAEIRLESTPGKGTTVMVTFPGQEK